MSSVYMRMVKKMIKALVLFIYVLASSCAGLMAKNSMTQFILLCSSCISVVLLDICMNKEYVRYHNEKKIRR